MVAFPIGFITDCELANKNKKINIMLKEKTTTMIRRGKGNYSRELRSLPAFGSLTW